MEEKGSDVNLATYMLVDAFRKDCDQLIVITNDSDLTEPIRIINKELSLPVGVFNPHSTQSRTLQKVAKFSRDIKIVHLAAAQFPVAIVDAAGKTIHKPPSW
jgi:hypothetical protein